MPPSESFLLPTENTCGHGQRKKSYQAAVNDEVQSSVALSENESKAGKDGYSLLRQPLHKSSWDPKVDPVFEAPSSLNEKSQQQQNNDWWAGKIQPKSRPESSIAKVELPTEDFTPQGEMLDLFQRSIDTIDFPFVIHALVDECLSLPGKKRAQEALAHQMNKDIKPKDKESATKVANRPLVATSPDGVRARYKEVQEMQWLLDEFLDLGNPSYKNRLNYKVTIGRGNPPPLEGVSFDLDSILEIMENDNVLEGPELLDVWTMMNAFQDLQLWSNGLRKIEAKEFVALPGLLEGMQLNDTLHDLLDEAFDERGSLSSKTFPTLGRLREKIKTLKTEILSTLDSLVNMPSVKSKLELESGGPLYSEISNGGGRLVIPMKPRYASQFGIVHDSSRSGKTVYVEPSEIITPTNELRQTEAELRSEEARVWRYLTDQVWSNRYDLKDAVEAVGQVDLTLARCLLGAKIGGVIPEVGNEGIISLKNAKHPVLLLRKIDNVVGSDLDLGANGNQGLVLTGPNSGGKTVILKLLGLAALLARTGIPVPATPSCPGYEPRVDYFDPVLADIGDIQSVGSDLSTFSGHLLVCREVLANSGKDALVLMDEVGSGTDPAQGVAIAQALLEALLATGCRVAITTHYMALKQLAASDDRFSVGGMQFVKGRPTYKLLPGTVGESFAISVAERLGLPQPVIARANELLDSETRQMGDLIRDLEDQKALIDERVEELEQKQNEMKVMEQKMKEEQNKLERKMLTARRDEAKKFAKALEEKEAILEDVLKKLKSDPSKKLVAKSWDDIRFVKRDAISEAENVPSVLRAKKIAKETLQDAQAELVPIQEMRERPELKEGDELIVCKIGPLFQRQAIVEKILGRQVQVKVSGVTMAMKLTDVALKPADVALRPTVSNSSFNLKTPSKGSKLSKTAERALKSEMKKAPASVDPAKPKQTIVIRTESNTVDVRGCNFEEAKDRIRTKISKAIINQRGAIFVLHGHGTGGVLKTKLRRWFQSEKKLVKQWGAAEQSDGGDAFTRLELN
ncbi:unnamed protein product [Cylindrotheca closterium]|uniref:Smr domain-containing protein n=1 Tax=Cylindrotheca closterium TaxID=2856 RepID=A0AAD2FYE5_9STRA|nr:unnamed protein product [Cylindrotheca closterium]